LEIKLQDEAPAYIQSLLDGGMLREVTKFSKFLTGCALLHTDRLKVALRSLNHAQKLPLVPAVK
jgi:SPX domain protein involved in polyphosphate accumulation